MALSLDPLLSTHKEDIRALRVALGDSLPATWDDVWLLRYCLSFPDAAERVGAVRSCIGYRNKYAVMLGDASVGRPPPHEIKIRPYMVQGFHGYSRLGEPLFIVRAGVSSPPSLVEAVPPAEILEWLMYFKEVAFQRCDAESRARRTIVKMISVVDMAHMRFANIDRRFFAVLADSSKLSEIVYPQLLERNVALHPPAFIHAIFSTMKHILPRKTIEKHAFCPGGAGVAMSAAGCPYASKRFDVPSLPSFVGGACQCTAAGGCICGVPNSESAPLSAALLLPGAKQSINVPARSHHDLILPAREPGSTLLWALQVEDKGLEVSAWVLPHALGPGGSAPEPVELIARRKVTAAEGRVAGEVPVPVAGTVTVRLDNSHSMLTGKRAVVEARVAAATSTSTCSS